MCYYYAPPVTTLCMLSCQLKSDPMIQGSEALYIRNHLNKEVVFRCANTNVTSSILQYLSNIVSLK